MQTKVQQYEIEGINESYLWRFERIGFKTVSICWCSIINSLRVKPKNVLWKYKEQRSIWWLYIYMHYKIQYVLTYQLELPGSLPTLKLLISSEAINSPMKICSKYICCIMSFHGHIFEQNKTLINILKRILV